MVAKSLLWHNDHRVRVVCKLDVLAWKGPYLMPLMHGPLPG
jgi:hypothetical protein